MSGHSKWATIKRAKSANDAKRGALFTRLSREIIVAVREGGPNPDANFRLRLAIDRARAANMPKENIERAIARASGQGGEGAEALEEITYEVYLPHKVPALIQVLTDNRNRTVAELRRIITRAGGQFDGAAVSWQFSRKGVIVIERTDKVNPDEVFEIALEAGAEDINIGDEAIEITTSVESFRDVREALLAKGYELASAELSMVPSTYIELDKDKAAQVLNLIETLEEMDDVQQVYHNLQIPAEQVAA
ncbi:MAG: YebC/PmpR family DNA-binding transcriptional regulator [Anaerolineae bacterium]|nr:YebC/PmpR family DNA-binding transcriptional regulator [Thermoflexales bacterium]MCX7940043.1 YebC/PmpR family DNA-binding transcriptional regulator [Thermoflexales bacterium]MDW8053151.1 YebC/PmpR family DNA-binding transcriptional regulator [Anaerolineae bacterium]MDW8291803.1 YebC/PmpR family DNA-binding transcriptional regulator [Anaerolineae bacterium]